MFVGELYEEDDLDLKMQDEGFISGNEMKMYLISEISSCLTKATLSIPESVYILLVVNKVFTEYLGYLLTEMQYLQRAYPDANW